MAQAGEASPPHPPRRLIGELLVSQGADAGQMIAVADGTVLQYPLRRPKSVPICAWARSCPHHPRIRAGCRPTKAQI
jgi:hypothetical protein